MKGTSSIREESLPLTGENRENAEANQRNRRSCWALWNATTCHQKLMLLYFLAGDLVVFLCVFMPIPFMTKTILSKGGTEFQSAILLQIAPLAMAVSSLVFGKYQIYVDSKSLLISGLFCYAIGQACFGLLDYSESVNALVAGGIIIRGLQGIAEGAYFVAEITIICQEFPDHRTQVFGMAESMIAIGYIAGPLAGSLLYRISEGMLVPFVISGGIMVPLIPCGYFLFGKYCAQNDGDRSSKILKVLHNPAAILILGSTCMAEGGIGLVIVLGSVFALSRGLTVVEVGLALLSSALTYAITSFFIGIIASIGRKARRALLAVGVIGLLVYPVMYTQNQTRIGIFIGLSVGGMLSAFTMVSGFSELMYQTVGNGSDADNDFALHSAISGVWNLAIGVGAFLFPFVGSLLHNFLPLPLVFICTAGVEMGLVLLAVVCMIAMQHFS